jgi:spermidine synthase
MPKQKIHPATILLAICLFASGASGLITQYIVANISGQILGGTAIQIAVVVGCMMAGYGIAGQLQNKIKKNLIAWFITIECLLAAICGTATISMQSAYSYAPEHFQLIQYSITTLIGILVGLEIPLVLRINQRFVKELGGNIATTFSWDYFGAALGSLIYIWLLSKIGLTEIAIVSSGANLLIAIATIIFFLKKTPAKLSIGLIAPAIAAAILISAQINYTKIETIAKAQLYDDPVILSAQSPYQEIIITHNPTLDDTRLYLNGSLQFSSVDEFIYHENLVHPAIFAFKAQHGRLPNSVIILGGGDGMAAREIQKYKEIQDITLVDLDPKITEISRNHPLITKINEDSLQTLNILQPKLDQSSIQTIWSEDSKGIKHKNAKVTTLNFDAEKYIKETKGLWELVIIDFPDPNHIDLGKLYSQEFFEALRKNCSPKVFIAIQSTSPLHAPETFFCIGRTLKAAGWTCIPYHENVPTFGDWGWYLGWSQNIERNEVTKNFIKSKEYSIPTKHATPQQFVASTIFGKNIKSTHLTINTRNNPLIVNHYLTESWLLP